MIAVKLLKKIMSKLTISFSNTYGATIDLMPSV